MKGLFVTATGTEIGKTFVTASICHQLLASGKPVKAIKPIISGVTNTTMDGSDTAIIAESLGMDLCQATWDAISPFRYEAPLAPSMAAKLEGKSLDYESLIKFCRAEIEHNDFTLIEGVGGSFVPLDEQHLVANWISDLGLHSIVVAGSYLGTLSHITATLEAMQARGLPVHSLIISESAGANHPDFSETIAQAAQWTNVPIIPVKRLPENTKWDDKTPLLAALKL